MENSILCNNQARCAGIIVNNVSKMLDALNTSTHVVTFPNKKVDIPIELYGPVPYLPIRYPTDQDIETYQHIDIIPNESWDPSYIGISSVSSNNKYYRDK